MIFEENIHEAHPGNMPNTRKLVNKNLMIVFINTSTYIFENVSKSPIFRITCMKGKTIVICKY